MKSGKRILATILAAILLVTSAPLSGFVGLELSGFSGLLNFSAKAATENGFVYEVEAGKAEITNYTGEGGFVTIPSTLGGCPVTSIGYEAFIDRTGLTSVTIPDSVTSIGDYAFCYCIDLTSITIPDSVTSIGEWAFSDCESLTSITIPDSVTSIGGDAFSGCTGLTSVTIPDSVTSIGEWAFEDCTGLTSVKIGNGVTEIGSRAFKNCEGLKSITIGNGVTSIGYEAFYGCTGLTQINVSKENEAYCSVDGVVYSKDMKTLILCPTGRSEVTISNSVTSIGELAFNGCTGLTSITIPDSVTNIGMLAFYCCTGLTQINVSKENEAYCSVDGVVYSKDMKTLVLCPEGKAEVTIPDSVTSIGDYAFSCCTGLTSITIPDSVTSIGEGAFAHCIELADIEISKNIADIGYAAFANCINLKVVKLPKSIKTIGEYAFGYYYDEENDAIAKVSDFVIHGFTGTVAESYANKNGFVFAPHTEKEIKDEKTGITIIIPDTDGKDVELNVVPVTSGEVSDALNTEKSNFKKSLFDITTTIDGEAVQLDGTVLVKIPLPEGYNPEKTVVYHVSDDGKLERLESSIADGYVVFETTHFSYYAIVDETEQKEPEQPPQPDPSANCNHICHKGGISKFFYKIALFFWKLFKTHKYCSCGVAHY